MKKMVKEYRVWNDGSSQGHYIVADSPKKAVSVFMRGMGIFYFPIHVILWKSGGRMTKEAVEFRDYRGDDKYRKFGRKIHYGGKAMRGR